LAQTATQIQVMPELRPGHGPKRHPVEDPEGIGSRRPTYAVAEFEHLPGIEIWSTAERLGAEQLLKIILAIAQQRLDRRRAKRRLLSKSDRPGEDVGGGEAQQVFFTSQPAQLPPRMQARTERYQVFVEEGIAGFDRIGQRHVIGPVQESGKMNL